jgi:hypothetical protein
MLIALGILAIVLATLALIPYGLEIWLWHHRKPRLSARVLSQEFNVDSTTHEVDIRFWLYVGLKQGFPAYVRDLQVIIPLEAKPYQHPASNEVFQQKAYLDGSGIGQALIIGASHRPISSKYSECHLIAFRVPEENFISSIDLVVVMEIDETKLGFWAIFYHTRRYSDTLTVGLSKVEASNMSTTQSH